MKIFYILKLIVIITIVNLSYNGFTANMKDAPYHHLANGTFRNPEGSPERDPNIKWSMTKWNKEKKKISVTSTKGIYKRSTNESYSWIFFTSPSWQTNTIN